MKHDFEKLLDTLDSDKSLIIGEQTFVDEVVADESLQCSIVGTVNFYGVKFKNVDWTGSTIVNCKFKNCIFIDVTFRKCDFFGTTFENCKIETSDFTRVGFAKGKFQNCNFWNVDLTASRFENSEFNDTKFDECKLDLIVIESVKVCNLNQFNLVKASTDFGKFLKDNL